MDRTLAVVVVCEINVDIVVTGLDGPPIFGAERLVDAVELTAGSSGVLTATNLADLGLRVGVCGLVGEDRFGSFMLEHLDRHGIDRRGVLVDPQETTGVGVLLSTSADRAILTMLGSMARFGLRHLDFSVVAAAHHLHLSSFFLQQALRPDVAHLLARAHRLGLTTSVDPGHDPEDAWQIGELLRDVDVFLPNEIEACAISGTDDAYAALDWLAARVPAVVVKRGHLGAIAAQGREWSDLPGFSVRARDTTGAGDAFDAGFLSRRIAGDDLAACVRFGNACGALAAAHVGGSGAIDEPRLERLLRGERFI